MKNTETLKVVDDHESTELSLKDYLGILSRYRIIFILIIVVVVMTFVSLYVFTPKSYSARARILSINPNQNVSVLERMRGQTHAMMTDPNTITRIAESTGVLRKSLQYIQEEIETLKKSDKFNFDQEEAFIANRLNETSILGAIKIGEDRVSMDIVNVIATVVDGPNLCAIIANSMSKAILEALTNNNKKVYEREALSLEQLIKENERQMLKIEEDVRSIISSEVDFQLALDDQSLSRRLSALENELSEAESRKKENEDQIDMIKAEFGIKNVPFEQVRWIDLSSPMFRKLQDLQFQREELLTRYYPENPSVKKIDNQIQSLRETLRPDSEEEKVIYVEVDSFKSGMVTRLQQLITETSALKKRIVHIQLKYKETQNKILTSPEKQKRVVELRKKKDVLEKLQINLHTNLQMTRMNLIGTHSNFEILEKAIPALGPSSTSLINYIIKGLAFGVVLGMGVVFVLNYFENTLKSTLDLKRHFKYPSLGGIPNWKFDEMFIDEMQPNSRISEVYAMLRNQIRFSSHNRPEKCLMVSSAFQGEGKSITAMNLALSFALEGNQVLLVSSDLRRPDSLTELLESPQENGIVEYLEGQVDMKSVIYRSIASNLSVVPTTHRSNNPTKLLKTQQFSDLLEYGEKNYDILIVDSPAVLPVVDSTMFASQVRGLLILVEAEKTPITSVNELIGRLEHVGAPIIGICLNNIKDLRLEYQYNYQGALSYNYIN